MPPNNSGRDSNEKLMESYKKVLEAESQEKRLDCLTDFTFGFAGSIFKRLRALRARLPFPPWLVKTATSVGLVGVLGAGVWLVRMDARAGLACQTAEAAKTAASEAKATAQTNYDKIDDRLRPTEQGVVKLNADMQNLLMKDGVQPSTRAQRRRIARELGLPVGTTATDSGGP